MAEVNDALVHFLDLGFHPARTWCGLEYMAPGHAIEWTQIVEYVTCIACREKRVDAQLTPPERATSGTSR